MTTKTITAETHATPITDSELWAMVMGPYTTPGEEDASDLRHALTEAIDQGLVVEDFQDAYERLCRIAGVDAG
jgi:hypothetical protein